MRVLSLFDGMSCGQIALKEIGITPEVYYASEIDKFAIKQTQLNFPNTIQVGDVRDLNVEDLGRIDLILAGSPCTDMSFSGKRKGLSTVEGIEVKSLNEYLELKKQGFEFAGQSYLFWEFIRILNDVRKTNPDVLYWCSAESSNSFVLVAYAEDEDSIKELWPEAYDINVLEKDTEIRFTLRFPKPEWYELYERELEECDRFIWVTDACLRDGIIRKVKAKIKEYGGLLLADIPDRFTPYEIGRDAFESKEEALKHAEERRAHLIESIKKQLNKLENLKFECDD